MAIPTHRDDCETKTWKTSCPDCGRPVWFLQCTCGSKVFFDSLGYPWPLHSDNCPVYYVRQLIDEGTSVNKIRSFVESYSRRLGKPIPPEVDELLSSLGAASKPMIKVIVPDPKPIRVSGIVKRNDQFSFFKRLQISDNPINRKVLKQFALLPYSEVVIQGKDPSNQRIISQWTFLISSDNLIGNGFRIGLEVEVDLHAVEVYDNDVFWVASSIDWK